jgi:hypothetical protein
MGDNMKHRMIIRDFKGYWANQNGLNKALLITLSILYLFIPQFLIIPFALYLFYEVEKRMKKWKHYFITLGVFILIYAIAIALFVSFLLLTTETLEDKTFTYTDIELTAKETKLYQKMINEVDFYVIDPLMTEDGQPFKLIGLIGYNTGYWFNRSAIDYPEILLIPYYLDQGVNDLFISITYHEDIDELFYSVKHQMNKIISLNPNQNVTSIQINVENGLNQVIYSFDEITIYHNRLEHPLVMDFGGQYDPTPLKTYLLNIIASYIATVFMVSAAYIYHLKYKRFIIEK